MFVKRTWISSYKVWQFSAVCTRSLSQRLDNTEAVVQSGSVKKVFQEISQKLQENTYARVSFCNLIKKRLWHRCFPVNFVKFLRTPFFIEQFWWLFLIIFDILKEIMLVNFIPLEMFTVSIRLFCPRLEVVTYHTRSHVHFTWVTYRLD